MRLHVKCIDAEMPTDCAMRVLLLLSLYDVFLFCLSENSLSTHCALNETNGLLPRGVIIFDYETRAKVYVSLADSEYVPLNFKDVFSRELKKFSVSLPRPVYFTDNACLSSCGSSNAIAYIFFIWCCERQILLSAVKSILY